MEEVDFDPSRIESLDVRLQVNDTKVINGVVPWFVDEVNEKICRALGDDLPHSFSISGLSSKSMVAVEFLDALVSREFPD